MAYRTALPTDPDARLLLERYFEFRRQGFTGKAGYVTVPPGPEAFTPPNGEFVVVEDDEGAAIGCGGVRRVEPAESGAVRYEIKHLWLEPAARGNGAGRTLLSELEARAKKLGAAEVVLDTNSDLAAAGGLYRSSGYADIPAYNENPNATNWYLKRL